MISSIINAATLFATIFSIAIMVLVYILTSLGYMKCMEKAGVEKWKAWIPFYNDIVMFKIVGLSPWLATIGIIKTCLGIISVVITVLTFGSMKEDLSDALENEINYSGSGYYYNYDESDVVRIRDKYTKNKLTTDFIFSAFETVFSIGALVVSIFFAIYIAKAYGLSGGYIAGMILVPFIFLPIIGYGKSEYKGRYSISKGTVEL